jgi:hypothetical protein
MKFGGAAGERTPALREELGSALPAGGAGGGARPPPPKLGRGGAHLSREARRLAMAPRALAQGTTGHDESTSPHGAHVRPDPRLSDGENNPLSAWAQFGVGGPAAAGPSAGRGGRRRRGPLPGRAPRAVVLAQTEDRARDGGSVKRVPARRATTAG